MEENLRRILERSRDEIASLRHQNNILSAQMNVVEIFAAALGLKKEHGMMSPDVVYDLTCKINEMEMAEKLAK